MSCLLSFDDGRDWGATCGGKRDCVGRSDDEGGCAGDLPLEGGYPESGGAGGPKFCLAGF